MTLAEASLDKGCGLTVPIGEPLVDSGLQFVGIHCDGLGSFDPEQQPVPA